MAKHPIIPFRGRPDWLIALGLSLLLAGCTTTLARLAYPRLDWGLAHLIDSFFTPTASQRGEIDRQSQALLDWHCREQLPRYAEWLEQLQQEIESRQLTAERLHLRVRDLYLFWDRLAERLAQAFAPLAADLSPEQIEEIAQTFARKTADEQRQIKPEAADRKRQLKRIQKLLGYWIGGLNPEQEQRLHDLGESLRPIAQEKSANRKARRELLRQWLSSGAAASALEPKLRRWLTYQREDWLPAFREVYRHNEGLILERLGWLVQHLNAEQQQHLGERLTDWSQTLRTLSCRG